MRKLIFFLPLILSAVIFSSCLSVAEAEMFGELAVDPVEIMVSVKEGSVHVFGFEKCILQTSKGKNVPRNGPAQINAFLSDTSLAGNYLKKEIEYGFQVVLTIQNSNPESGKAVIDVLDEHGNLRTYTLDSTTPSQMLEFKNKPMP